LSLESIRGMLYAGLFILGIAVMAWWMIRDEKKHEKKIKNKKANDNNATDKVGYIFTPDRDGTEEK
jgi:hypothetical protein